MSVVYVGGIFSQDTNIIVFLSTLIRCRFWNKILTKRVR